MPITPKHIENKSRYENCLIGSNLYPWSIIQPKSIEERMAKRVEIAVIRNITSIFHPLLKILQ